MALANPASTASRYVDTPVRAPTSTASQYVDPVGGYSAPNSYVPPPVNNYNTMGPVANRSPNPPAPGEKTLGGIPGDMRDPANQALLYQQYLQNQANSALFNYRQGLYGIQNEYADAGAAARYAGEDYQNQLDQLNWLRGGLANDQANASQNLAYRDQIIANLQKNYGINDAALANQIAQSILDQSVNTNILNTNIRQNQLDTLQKTQAANSRAIAGGGMFFGGHQIGLQQTRDAGSMAEDILNNRLRGVVEGGDLTRQGYNIGAQKERNALDNSILNQQMSRLGDQSNVFNMSRMGEKYDITQRGYLNQLNQAREGAASRQAAAAQQIQQLRNSGDAQQRQLAEDLAKLMGIA